MRNAARDTAIVLLCCVPTALLGACQGGRQAGAKAAQGSSSGKAAPAADSLKSARPDVVQRRRLPVGATAATAATGPRVESLLVSFRVGGTRGGVRRFRLYRERARWWVVWRQSDSRSLARYMKDLTIAPVLLSVWGSGPFKGALPDPDSAAVNITLFGADDRFLLRAMKHGRARGTRGWSIYKSGRLEGPSSGRMGRAAARLVQSLTRMTGRGRGRWLLLPEEGWSMEYKHARGAGRALARLRRRLRRCFRKPGPYSVPGSLRLMLTAQPDGRIVAAKVLGKIRKPATPVWCAVWNVKRMKVHPFGGAPVRYRLAVP